MFAFLPSSKLLDCLLDQPKGERCLRPKKTTIGDSLNLVRRKSPDKTTQREEERERLCLEQRLTARAAVTSPEKALKYSSISTKTMLFVFGVY